MSLRPRLVVLAACLAASLAAACASTTPAGVAAPEQRSIAEYDLAREAWQNGRLREALAHVDQAISLDEANADAAYLGGVVMLAFCSVDERSTDCRYPDAEKYLRRALKVAPDMREAKNALGVVLVQQKKYPEAIELLKLLANDIQYASPENAWGNLGWAYLLSGRVDDAVDALRRSTAAQPMFCVGHYRLGLAYEKKGEAELASEAFSRALDVQHPQCQRLQDAYEARARVLEKLGRAAEAKVDFERCRDLAKTTPAGRRCSERL